MYQYSTVIQVRNTDALGRLYFADQFNLCHDAYQSFMTHIGFPMPRTPTDCPHLAIVHAEGDYHALLMIDDPIEVHMTVASLGNASITFQYHLYRNEELVGKAQIIHVVMDPVNACKMTIPPAMREQLETHLAES